MKELKEYKEWFKAYRKWYKENVEDKGDLALKTISSPPPPPPPPIDE